MSCDVEETQDLQSEEVSILPQPKGEQLHASKAIVDGVPYAWTGHALASIPDFDGDDTPELAVGAYGIDHEGLQSGAIYVFTSTDLQDSNPSFQNPSFEIYGEEPKDHFGYQMASNCDVDGDGLGDILISAPYNKKVHLFWGDSISESTRSSSDSNHFFLGENAGDYLGWSMACIGDWDGDGGTEILLGADGSDYGGFSSGLNYMVLSSSISEDRQFNIEDADYKYIGSQDLENAGQSVAALGDVNGDGLQELLIGGDGNSEAANEGGAAYLITSPSLRNVDISLQDAPFRFLGSRKLGAAGTSLRDAGDVDGDGLSDIIIGAPFPDASASHKGRAYLIYASQLTQGTMLLEEAGSILIGKAENAAWSLGSLEDLEDDGGCEVLIGAPALYRYQDPGRVYVVYSSQIKNGGSFNLHKSNTYAQGENARDRFGKAMLTLGDLDGNGLEDFVVAAPEYGLQAGAVYLFSGAQ
ncbi:MAG: hypothetical protein CMK59_12490 [Proteobacteria bacterium]|nr:hypothetical protein [Pseudomonadota bacterium]